MLETCFVNLIYEIHKLKFLTFKTQKVTDSQNAEKR